MLSIENFFGNDSGNMVEILGGAVQLKEVDLWDNDFRDSIGFLYIRG